MVALKAVVTSTRAIMPAFTTCAPSLYAKAVFMAIGNLGLKIKGGWPGLPSPRSKGGPISIYGNGKQVRDVLFIDDLLNGYEAIVQNIDRASGQVYNIGGGPENTVSVWTEFGEQLERLLRRPIPVTYGDWRPGDQPIYVSDIRKAATELGWQPRIGVQEGGERLFHWICENRELFAHL